MLGRLIREIAGRAFGKERPLSGGAAAVAAAPEDPIVRRDREFRAADATRREVMLGELRAELAAQGHDKRRWVLLGDWLYRVGNLKAAEDAYREAIKVDALSPSAHEGLGLALLGQRRLDEAHLHFEASNRFKPGNADVLNHWGLVFLEAGNFSEASDKFELALQYNVENAHAWHNLGLAAVRRGKAGEGIRHLRRALAIRPDMAVAQCNLALALRDSESVAEAIVAADAAISLKPHTARPWVIKADFLVDLGDFVEAQNCVERAFEIDGTHAGAHIVAAKLAQAKSEYGKAEAHYRQVRQDDPLYADARGGLGQLELLLGRFEEGWPDYEARCHTQNPAVRSFGLPRWPEALSAGESKRVLVYSEQGLGDIILFSTCMPDLIAETQRQGLGVVFETYPRLVSLMQRSFPEVTVASRDESAKSMPAGMPREASLEIPIGSLPLHFRRTPADFPPASKPVLRADPDRVLDWKRRLHGLSGRPTLGLSWKGGLVRSASRQRTISLTFLAEKLAGLDVELISLQYGDVDADVEACLENSGIRVHHWAETIKDLDDAAALTAALDAVLTVCNTQAHMTGALGQRGVVLVPGNPSWRYGSEGDRMVWYPSLHLIRQRTLADWSTPLDLARDWLRAELVQEGP